MRPLSRRRVLGACTSGVALSAGCLGELTDANGDENETESGDGSRSDIWASFRGDSTNSGFSEVEGLTGDPDRRWTAEVSGPRTAAIADGTVYLAAGSTLHAFDLADGDERWTVDLEGEATGSPAVADDAVVCPIDGALIVADRDGGQRERIAFGGVANIEPVVRGQYSPRVRSSPTVVDGTAYVGTGDELVAVDLEEWEIDWRTETTAEVTSLSQERGTGGGVTSPAVVDGRAFVGTGSGVAALDAADGSIEWTRETDRSVRSSPAVVDGTVYVGGTPPMALSAADGDVAWRADDAFESLRGSRSDRWSNELLATQEIAPMAPSPAVADEVVVVHDSDERLLALERDDGDLRWETPLERIESLSTTQLASSWSSPSVAGDVVVVGTSNGIVAASLGDGEPLWYVPTDDRVVASPAVADGTVVIGDEGGTIYALEESN